MQNNSFIYSLMNLMLTAHRRALRWQEACLRPPLLELQPARLPPVALPAGRSNPNTANPNPAEPATSLALRLANAGGVALALHLSLEPRSGNLLRPGLWRDPGSNYTAAFAATSSAACCRSGSGLESSASQAGGGDRGEAPSGGAAAWGACSGGERVGAPAERGAAAAEDPGSRSGSGYWDTLREGVELRTGAAPPAPGGDAGGAGRGAREPDQARRVRWALPGALHAATGAQAPRCA